MLFKKPQVQPGDALEARATCPACRPRVLPGWAIDETSAPFGGPDDPAVLGLALAIFDAARDPATGAFKTGDELANTQHMAFKTGLGKLQEDAARIANAHDDAHLGYAQEADAEAGHGLATLAALPDVLNESCASPSGGQSTGVQIIQDHAAAKRLAAERPDDEHTKRPLGRAWVILAACVIALIDIALYWDFIFNLGAVQSLAAVLKWSAAACVAFLWAGAIHWTLSAFQARERVSRDLRAIVADHKRVAGRGRPPLGTALPTPAQIHAADLSLRMAQGILTLLILVHSAVLAGRVAQLVRQAGRPIVESAVFGAASGLFLCAFLIGVVMMMCRGNALGTLLDKGEEVVAEIAGRYEVRLDEARAARDRALTALAWAETAGSHGDEDRLWVQGKYDEAMGWAATWMGLDALPLSEQDVNARTLPTRNAAHARMEDARNKLAELTERLERVPDVFTAAGAVDRTSEHPANLGRMNVPARRNPPGVPSVIIPSGPAEPSSMPPVPSWLPAAGAVCALAAALIMAVVTPTPAEQTETVQTNS